MNANPSRILCERMSTGARVGFGVLLRLFRNTKLSGTVTVLQTMFKNLPRQTFGKLQAKLFPLCALCLAPLRALLLYQLVIPVAVIPSAHPNT